MDDYQTRLNRILESPLMAGVLNAAGGAVWLVGGSVRDLLLGRPVHDYDVVVPTGLEAAAERAAQSLGVRAVPMGRDPLTIYRLAAGDMYVDLCPLEGDDIRADLGRRDLTVNAMAVRLGGGRLELLDPHGGREDLDNRVVRFVSEANVAADPLRLLRLFRFAATLDFTPDPESLDIVRKRAASVRRSAGERVREELLKLFKAPRSARVVRSMLDTGLLEALIPEITPMRGCAQGGYHHLDVLEHTMAAVKAAEDVIAAPADYLPSHTADVDAWLAHGDRPALVKIALLLHDLGKPATRAVDEDGTVRFLGHAAVGIEAVERIAARFRMSGEETRLTIHLIRHHLRPFHLMDADRSGRLTGKGIYRFGRDLGGDLWGLIVHALADAAATRGPVQEEKGGLEAFTGFLEHVLAVLAAQKEKVDDAPPLIGGRDLMETFGLSPSPQIGRLLEAVREARALGRISTRAEALALAGDVLKNGDSGAGDEGDGGQPD